MEYIISNIEMVRMLEIESEIGVLYLQNNVSFTGIKLDKLVTSTTCLDLIDSHKQKYREVKE
jgi:hypothetical protein